MDTAADYFVSGAGPACKPEKAAEDKEDGQLAPEKITVSDKTGRYDGAAGLHVLPDLGVDIFI